MHDQANPLPYAPDLRPVRFLAPYACQWNESYGRVHLEEEDPNRSPYQRDRDRVIHSTAFRRLQYKTQVFIFHESDHYRTRLTHTLEVAQVARSIARGLHLDEDLTETLALAHDLGHPPFGHAGERALNRLMGSYDGYDHNAQSLRMVTRLEKRYGGFDGLNLTRIALDGLAKHNGPVNTRESAFYAKFAYETNIDLSTHGTLEAQVAAISDDIAYNAHDVEDGLRSGLIGLEQIRAVALGREVIESIEAEFPGLDARRTRYEITRRLITLPIRDVVTEVKREIETLRPETSRDIVFAGRQLVHFSQDMAHKVKELKEFLFSELYRHEQVMAVMDNADRIIDDLFHFHCDAPSKLPAVWLDRLDRDNPSHVARRVCDYVAGMTDRFAIQKHRELFDATPELR